MVIRFATATMCATLISANAFAMPEKSKSTSVEKPLSREEILIAAAKEDIRDRLKDPDSANFKNLSIHAGDKPTEGTQYVCGEVNSKNSYGGYVGFTQFYSLVFWEEKRRVAIVGTSAVYEPSMNQDRWAALYASSCAN